MYWRWPSPFGVGPEGATVDELALEPGEEGFTQRVVVASPMDPIEGWTPAWRHRCPKGEAHPSARGEREREGRSLRAGAAQLRPPPVKLGHRADDGEAETRSALAVPGGGETLEELLADGRIDAGTFIRDGRLPTVLAGSHLDQHAPAP